MKKINKEILVGLLFLGILFVSFNLIASYFYSHTELSVAYKIENDDQFQIFYSGNTEEHFDEPHSQIYEAVGNNVWNEVHITLPYKALSAVRIDLGQNNNQRVEIGEMKVSNFMGTTVLSPSDLVERFTFENAISLEAYEQALVIIKDNVDMYFYATQIDWGISEFGSSTLLLLALGIALLVDGVLYLIYRFTSARTFLKNLYGSRKIIYSLSKNDFRTKYAGSYLGIVWAFIQPIVTVVVYTFVFTIGFRSQPLGNVPFVNWLTAGILPWYFFSDAWINGSGSLLEYNYLVKKVVFNINILPIVKVLSSLYVHLFFMLIVVGLFLVTGYVPDLYWLQLIYYGACAFLLAAGLSYLTSAIILFLKDLGQFINIILQVGVWLTPIMWMSDMIPSRFLWVMKLNPMFYIVQGYRNAFIYKVWFWESYVWTIYFAFVTIFILVFGMYIFKKLKPHFADVI